MKSKTARAPRVPCVHCGHRISVNCFHCTRCGEWNENVSDPGGREHNYTDTEILVGLDRGTMCIDRQQMLQIAQKIGVDAKLLREAAFDFCEYIVVAPSLLMFSDQNAKECRKNLRRLAKKKAA